MLRAALIVLTFVASTPVALAAPVTYDIDPSHTYPSFEADHMGISVWRGKFNKSAGTIMLDKAAGTGSVDVSVEIDSVDFGHDGMNDHAKKDDILDAAAHPRAQYRGTLAAFIDGAPTRVDGELTLHGVTQPLVLAIGRFKCIEHPRHKREVCGADATASFDRATFGIEAGKAYGFDMGVTLRIQVEASAQP